MNLMNAANVGKCLKAKFHDGQLVRLIGPKGWHGFTLRVVSSHKEHGAWFYNLGQSDKVYLSGVAERWMQAHGEYEGAVHQMKIALQDLLDLKDHVDRCGRTPYYLIMRVKAWMKARMALRRFHKVITDA